MNSVWKVGKMDNNLIRFNKNLKCVFIDVETQNLCLNHQVNLPWQIAMLKTQGDEIIDSYDAYLKWNPLLRISEDAARITNYKERDIIEYGKDPLEVEFVMKEWLEDTDLIVGHNLIGFDTYLIQNFSLTLNKSPYNIIPKLYDTFMVAKGLYLNIPYRNTDNFLEYQYKLYHKIVKGARLSLNAVAKSYNIVVDETKLHNAIYDLQINFQVFQKQKYQIDL